MNCKKADQHIHAWLDGELAPSEARNLKEHVLECTGCQQRLDELQRLYNDIGALPGPPPTPDLIASTLLAARNVSIEKPVGSWWLALPTLNKGLGITALAAGLLLGVFLYTATFYSTAIASSTTSTDTLSVLIDGQGEYL
ncbi:anti-sigma factor family protein [Desulfovibrio ferrophilus]|uniref:Putative transmembrane transcriptional regulator n=1 Tax=Desulfovibrio ferrophilus TaxID=241368 RepID=A0A2Z6AV54_9BACT|nr:zf-HC2 domain-containing protein [Desulfovibrio ferrophilus]BBD07111.1 putative transmembrane transcriptional regulator [Desulfovibrio ferrophilus]